MTKWRQTFLFNLKCLINKFSFLKQYFSTLQFFRFSEEKKIHFTHVSSMNPLDFKGVVKMKIQSQIYTCISISECNCGRMPYLTHIL